MTAQVFRGGPRIILHHNRTSPANFHPKREWVTPCSLYIMNKSKLKLRFLKHAQNVANPLTQYSKYLDLSGKLVFEGKAILSSEGVDFTNGSTYKIRAQDFQIIHQIGKGQYGTVQKVLHAPTRVVMAMKEIRLELNMTKLNQILMELDVLHKSVSPYIVEFYGAFLQDQVVFYCMQYMVLFPAHVGCRISRQTVYWRNSRRRIMSNSKMHGPRPHVSKNDSKRHP